MDHQDTPHPSAALYTIRLPPSAPTYPSPITPASPFPFPGPAPPSHRHIPAFAFAASNATAAFSAHIAGAGIRHQSRAAEGRRAKWGAASRVELPFPDEMSAREAQSIEFQCKGPS